MRCEDLPAMADRNLEEEVQLLRIEVERLKKSSATIPPHKHCLNCGIAIPPDKVFCSKKCEDEWNALVRKKKINLYVWMIFLAILIIILFLSAGGI